MYIYLKTCRKSAWIQFQTTFSEYQPHIHTMSKLKASSKYLQTCHKSVHKWILPSPKVSHQKSCLSSTYPARIFTLKASMLLLATTCLATFTSTLQVFTTRLLVPTYNSIATHVGLLKNVCQFVSYSHITHPILPLHTDIEVNILLQSNWKHLSNHVYTRVCEWGIKTYYHYIHMTITTGATTSHAHKTTLQNQTTPILSLSCLCLNHPRPLLPQQCDNARNVKSSLISC